MPLTKKVKFALLKIIVYISKHERGLYVELYREDLEGGVGMFGTSSVFGVTNEKVREGCRLHLHIRRLDRGLIQKSLSIIHG